MESNELLVKRDKIQREILALESTLGAESRIIDLLSSDSSSDDDESDYSGPEVEGVERDDLEAKRLRIQREIEELENTLGANAALVDVLDEREHDSDSSDEDSDDDELDLPQNVETCLQMNLVYQEVLKEKLAELEKLLNENQQQQKEIEAQISGPSTSSSSVPGIPPQKLFLGYFMKPYFKDKLTGLGPPANEETKARLSHDSRTIDEIKRWDGWQKTLLTDAVAKDTMKRMLQPKLSKLDYLSAKMSRADDEGKEELKKQNDLIEKEIAEISALRDDQLLGNRHDDHDWEKISNIDFEGLRQAEDLKRFWQNYLHPSINKSVWKQDEIDELKRIVEEYNCCHWDKIAEALGTNRTAFMCFQTYQRYISKTFRRKEWTKEEDEILRKLVEKMKIGNFIPYIQMSYFMEGRDGSQLAYRWTSVLDPSIKKGPWSKEEDQLLRNAVAKYGTKEWGKIRLEVPGRTDGACRDRYLDCLQQNVKKGPWSKEEVELLKEKVAKYGVGKWTKIASEIPNRVDCQCLNKWKLLTQASKSKACQGKGKKRQRKPTTVPRKRKRQKALKTIKEEILTSSEDEKHIKYMDSDVETDVPLVKVREIPRKDYVQPDMKAWIPVNANTGVHSLQTVRTVWVHPPSNEEELEKSTLESGSGRIPSKNSKCPKVTLALVRNTILNRFGNVERTYVGLKPTVLQSQTDDEKAMLKVSVSDIKHFLQWKGASVVKKEKMTSPKNIKKRRSVQDMASLNNDLFKAITPWIGNVILPAPVNKNTFCEGDIVGMKAEDIALPKTSVFSFFLKAFQIDVKGCRNVIEIQQMINIKKPIAQSKPRAVSVILKDAKRKAEHKKPAEPPQHPPPLQPVLLNPLQLPVRQMTTPTLIQPKTLVITQPNKQRAVQPLLIKSPPQVLSQIPLPLIQLTAPAQPVMASTPKSPSTEDSNSIRSAKRIRKPTEKVQALMEEAKAKGSKKESQKLNQGKQNVVFPTITLQMQAVNWIFTPTKLVQVTGPLSANIPSNQTLTVPNSSTLNNSISPCISTNLYPASSALDVAASSVSPALIHSSVSNAPRDTLKTSSSVNISPNGIQTPLSPTSTLVQSKSVLHSVQMLSPTPIKVDQKGSHVEATKNSSDFTSDESIVRQYQISTSTGSRVSPAVFSVLPVPLTVPPLASSPVVLKPTNNVAVAKSPGVTENGCVLVRTNQLPTVIQQKSLPDTILSPLSASSRPIASSPQVVVQIVASSPQIVASSPQIVASSPQIVASSPQIVASSSQIVTPSTRIGAPSPQIMAPSPRIMAPSPRIVAPSTQIVAPSARVVAPPPQIVAPSTQIAAPSTRIAAPSVQIAAPSVQIVAPSPQIMAPLLQIVAPPPRTVAPPPRIMAPSPRIMAPSPQIVAPSARVVATSVQFVAPSPQIVAPSARIVASSPRIAASSPQIVAPSVQIVAPSPHIMAPSDRIGTPSPRIMAPSPPIMSPSSPIMAPSPPIMSPSPQIGAPSPRIMAPSPRIMAPSPRIVAPSPQIVAPSPQIVAPSRIMAPSPQIMAPSPQIVAPSTRVVAPPPQIAAPSARIATPSVQIVAPSARVVAQPPQIAAPSARIAAPSVQIVAPSARIVAPSEIPQIRTLSEPLLPIPDIPSDVVSFNPHLIFPEQSPEVDDWMNGKGGIPLPHLEMSLPYLPPSAASIKTLTSLLKVKQSLLAAAVNILPVEYQNYREEEAQVAAIRKMIAERFASNPAYQLLKARFLSCFTLPALLATINPSVKYELPTDNNGDEDEVLILQDKD
ncbi:snRNA-activating protein complex subunit 4-like [Sinocyclocheilus anshuiensis]|uniref:snRNA-activating protein complex subunit 4-like n=1 Tax=Sinocyclocheilus anshuiensis TaxID=1608454 RepID=UPI0007BA8ABD|nr:PREDICTED: snRNA-activating protein complex subunit 4-like [Sinocyclocheilus anshuiensis]